MAGSNKKRPAKARARATAKDRSRSAPRTYTPAQKVRGAILAIAATEVRTYNRRERSYESRPIRQREIAARLGVSERTLRRWKNEGKAPADPRRLQRVERIAAKVEREAETLLQADKRRHKGAPKLDKKKLPTVPRALRRKLTKYKTDRKTGARKATSERVDSSWLNYNVQGWQFSEILALLTQIWEQGFTFQFIYEIPKGGKYEDRQGKTRTVRKLTRVGTAPIPAYRFEGPEDLADFLMGYIPMESGRLARRMVYIAVDEKRIKRG